MLELSEIKKDLQAKEDLVKALQSEAHKLQYVHSPPSKAVSGAGRRLATHAATCTLQESR